MFYVTLAALTLVLAFTSIAGPDPALPNWPRPLAAIGLIALIHFLVAPRRDVRPLDRFSTLTISAFIAYIALQLVPLPATLLPRARFELATAPYAPITAVLFRTAVYLVVVIGCFLLFALIRDVAFGTRETPWAPVWPLLLIAGFQAALGLFQPSALGTYPDRDHYAALLEAVLPFAAFYPAALLLRDRQRHESPAAPALKACGMLVIAVALLIAIIHSSSTTGLLIALISLTLGAAIILSLHGWHVDYQVPAPLWRRSLPSAAALAIALAGFSFLPKATLIARLAGFAQTSEIPAATRVQLWHDTARLIRDYPITGSGLGSFQSVFYQYKTAAPMHTAAFVQNDYLQLLAETGLIGFLLAAALLVHLLRRTLHGALYARSIDDRYLSIATTASLIAILLHALVDNSLYVPINAFVFAWILGIAALHLRTLSPNATKPLAKIALCLAGALVAASSTALLTGQITPPETIASDPANPFLYCDVADSLRAAGHTQESRNALLRAASLGPNIPPLLMRVADGYLALGDPDAALHHFRTVLSLVRHYDSEIYATLDRLHLPAAAVLPNQASGKSYLNYLLDAGRLADAAVAWKSLRAQGFRDDSTVARYIDVLLGANEGRQARRIWSDYLGPNRGAYPDNNLVFNGHFDRPLSAVPLDWQIQPVEGVTAAIESQKLRIYFAGKANLDFDDISQLVYAPPGRYRFRARVRSDGLTTNRGLEFRLQDPVTQRIEWYSDPILGTNPWFWIQSDVRIPSCPYLVLSLVRRPSEKFDNKIKGTVWIDDVSLTPLP